VDKDRPARPGGGRSGKVLTQYRKSPETIEKSMISGLFALAAGEGFELLGAHFVWCIPV
jgi:hypothetical protein